MSLGALGRPVQLKIVPTCYFPRLRNKLAKKSLRIFTRTSQIQFRNSRNFFLYKSDKYIFAYSLPLLDLLELHMKREFSGPRKPQDEQSQRLNGPTENIMWESKDMTHVNFPQQPHLPMHPNTFVTFEILQQSLMRETTSSPQSVPLFICIDLDFSFKKTEKRGGQIREIGVPILDIEMFRQPTANQ